jgi:hypothetical protein
MSASGNIGKIPWLPIAYLVPHLGMDLVEKGASLGFRSSIRETLGSLCVIS